MQEAAAKKAFIFHGLASAQHLLRQYFQKTLGGRRRISQEENLFTKTLGFFFLLLIEEILNTFFKVLYIYLTFFFSIIKIYFSLQEQIPIKYLLILYNGKHDT